MKRPIAPPQINRRLVRFISWAGLWLVWAGAVLAGVSCGFRKSRKFEAPRHHLAQMTRFVLTVLMIRAASLVKHIQRGPFAFGPKAGRRMGWRAQIGGALRKKLRAPTLLGRIAKLRDALNHPEKYLRAIAKRIARNFTKVLRLYAPAFLVAALSAPLAQSEPAFDSS
ncbi:hypothetical protein U91I_01616 [alpha proteobacterium U9-1i]|nr:hypothetical protein U91I_01616 [alpha proteobacterium U9-1i]